jgi:cysteine desulfurase
MLTLDSGKLYGPRGVAALYLNDRVHLVPLQLGGGQERGLRAGTEHVALALGFAEAFASIARERDHESKRLRALRDAFIKDIHTSLPNAVVNGDTTRSLPHIINISLPATTSEYLTLALDYRGIAIATKSACREGDEQQSHVVAALHGDEWRSKNTLRFSIGRDTTHDDLVRTVETLVELVALHSRE